MSKKKEQAKAEKKQAPVPMMYVGPSVPGLAIQNRVYTEIPDYALEIIKGEPEIGNLFIPVEEYPVANRMLRERQGYVFNAYQKALKLNK